MISNHLQIETVLFLSNQKEVFLLKDHRFSSQSRNLWYSLQWWMAGETHLLSEINKDGCHQDVITLQFATQFFM